LNEGGTESPYNDIILERLDVVYTWSDASVGTATIGLADLTVPAGGQASVQFFPIGSDDFLFDDTTVELNLTFVGQTVSGHGVGRTSTVPLFIEDCMP